jgi:hypothetical protein
MRYYSFVITNATTGQVITTQSSASKDATYTSFVNNKTLPGALNVEIDITQAPFHNPGAGSWVRVWGVSLQEIAQAANLNGANIQVYGGMQAGYPLAKPQQAGLLITGSIYQAFGNWIETAQTLDLILTVPLGSASSPMNVSFNWKKGTPMARALSNTLSAAFPGFKQNINISPKLVLGYDQPGQYHSLEELSIYANGISKQILGSDYTGVTISVAGNTINVWDGTSPTAPKQIEFTNLIGQPTWIKFGTIQAAMVMRADLNVGDYIKLPQGILTTTAAPSFSQFRDKSTFQGTFLVNTVHHYGNYRQNSADAWTTIVECAAVPA